MCGSCFCAAERAPSDSGLNEGAQTVCTSSMARRFFQLGSVAAGAFARYGHVVTDVLPLNIFLATPSDADREREVVHRTVDEWNRQHSTGRVRFNVVGWESKRGTARRAQEAINELIGECHFLVAVFKERWGSETGSSWGYTSGTEEEIFTGLLELGQADQPMRDVWIGFVDSPAPGSAVSTFKAQLIERHSMLFESVTDVLDFADKISARLDGWGVDSAVKTPRHIELVSSTGSEVLRAARLRIEGEKLIELGQAGAGSANLRRAAAIGGPIELLAHARQLAREGELEEAHTTTQAAIEMAQTSDSGLFSALAAEAFAAQASVLRRRRDPVAAIGRLEQAITLVSGDDAEARRVRCRILDEIGLACKATNDLSRARAVFLEALELRRAAGWASEVAQSLTNLARLAVDEHDLATARGYADEVLSALENVPPTALHANAATLVAQVLLRQGEASGAIEHAKRSLSLNRQFGSANGEAIALYVMAQCYRAMGDFACAAQSAQDCLDINLRIGNTKGVENARWQLDAAANGE